MEVDNPCGVLEVGGSIDVALELADGGGADAALEPADDLEGKVDVEIKEGDAIDVVSVRLEELVDGVVVEEDADEVSLDRVIGDVDDSSSVVECRRLDTGDAFVDVGS